MKPAKILPLILQWRTSPYRVTSLTTRLNIRRDVRPITDVDLTHPWPPSLLMTSTLTNRRQRRSLYVITSCASSVSIHTQMIIIYEWQSRTWRPNVATLNVIDITNIKHLRLPDNDQRKSSIGSTPTIINSVPSLDEIGTLRIRTRILYSTTITPKFFSFVETVIMQAE